MEESNNYVFMLLIDHIMEQSPSNIIAVTWK